MAASVSTYPIALGLSCTTAASAVLIIHCKLEWLIWGSFYFTIANHRASTQLIVQVIAALLGLTQTTVTCCLINRGARVFLSRNPVARIGTLKAWTNLSIPRVRFDVPKRYLFLYLWLGVSVLFFRHYGPVH